jgi:hypothetical protein
VAASSAGFTGASVVIAVHGIRATKENLARVAV